MTADDKVSLLSAVIVLLQVVIGIWIYRRVFRDSPAEDEPEQEQDDTPDFEYLTVREQVETVKNTSDALQGLENLELSLEESTVDDVVVIRMEWMSRDGKNHALEVYCNGSDTASESLCTLAEAEIHETKKVLAYQCETLAKRTRSVQNCAQNVKKPRYRGGEDIDRLLRKVWEDNPDG